MCKSENFYKPKEHGRNSGFLLNPTDFFDFHCAMKKFLLALISALPLAAGADIDRIGGTLTPSSGNIPTIENTSGKNYSVSAKFDLSKIAEKRVVSARLGAVCEMSGGQDTSPSITVSHMGREFDAATLLGAGKIQDTYIDAGDIVNAALARGEKSVEFKLYSKCPDGAVPKITVKHATLVAASNTDVYKLDDILTPIFSGGKIRGESVFPLKGKDGSAARAKLLFAPREIDAAYTYRSGEKTLLQEGRDYKISGNTVEFLEGGAVETVPYSAIYADTKEAAKKNGNFFFFENLGKYAFFAEGKWFHQRDVFFDYKHQGQSFFNLPKRGAKSLPKTMKLLKSGKPVKIVLYGDSISAGANAPFRADAAPFSPTWAKIVEKRLQKIYGKNVELRNRALGGTTIGWGEKNIANLVLPDKPDLVILAFGMNDTCPPETRREKLESMIAKVRGQNPDAEFIIVSSMRANPLWQKRMEVQDEYPKIDKSLECESVAVANVRAAHDALLQKKRYIDMTGNNVNHPNKFLISVYAQTILKLLEK